jgi:hypothetical protein
MIEDRVVVRRDVSVIDQFFGDNDFVTGVANLKRSAHQGNGSHCLSCAQLGFRHDVGVGFLDPIDRMDFGNDYIGEGLLVAHFHEAKDVRLTKTWMDGLYAGDFLQGLYHILGFAGLDLD